MRLGGLPLAYRPCARWAAVAIERKAAERHHVEIPDQAYAEIKKFGEDDQGHVVGLAISGGPAGPAGEPVEQHRRERFRRQPAVLGEEGAQAFVVASASNGAKRTAPSPRISTAS
jgi:hypothetical protein